MKKLQTKIPASVPGPVVAKISDLLANYKNMHDRFGEFAQSLTIAYQATDRMQVSWFIENTIDNGQHLNANTTNLKVETALRLNVRF